MLKLLFFLYSLPLLLSLSSLKFLILLIQEHLSQSLSLLLGNLLCLLLRQLLGLNLRLLSYKLLPLLFLDSLQFLSQLCLGLGDGLSLLTLFLSDALFLELSLLFDGLFLLFFSQKGLFCFFLLDSILFLNFEQSELLLLVLLLSLGDGDLFCLSLQTDLCLLIELGQFLGLSLHLLRLLKNLVLESGLCLRCLLGLRSGGDGS